MADRAVWGFLLLSSVVLVSAPARSADPQDAAPPFFETFPLKFTEKPVLQGVQIIADQDPFAFPAQPSIALVPDGRLFLTWSTGIGFYAASRIVGAYSRDGGRTWAAPIELINHPDRTDENPVLIVDGARLLVIAPGERLPDKYDKFNPWPASFDRDWWYMTSTDDGGNTWTTPLEVKQPHLYANLRGSNGFRWKDGTLLLPYYYLPGVEHGVVPKLESEMVSADALARSTDGGRTWTSGQAFRLPESRMGADEPTTVVLSNGEILCLFRNSLDRLYQTRSRDGGMTWDAPTPSSLPAHNTPAWIHRLQNRPGDELVVAWDYFVPWKGAKGRSPLVVAHSPDGGHTWSKPKLIADPNPMEGYRADYPTICQTPDGTIVMVWMQETLPHHLGKELRAARFNRAWLIAN